MFSSYMQIRVKKLLLYSLLTLSFIETSCKFIREVFRNAYWIKESHSSKVWRLLPWKMIVSGFFWKGIRHSNGIQITYLTTTIRSIRIKTVVTSTTLVWRGTISATIVFLTKTIFTRSVYDSIIIVGYITGSLWINLAITNCWK